MPYHEPPAVASWAGQVCYNKAEVWSAVWLDLSCSFVSTVTRGAYSPPRPGFRRAYIYTCQWKYNSPPQLKQRPQKQDNIGKIAISRHPVWVVLWW